MFKKIKERMEKQKKAIVSALITCSLIAYNTAGVYATSGVSDNLSNASNGAQQEALSWIEAAGGFGIVVGALKMCIRDSSYSGRRERNLKETSDNISKYMNLSLIHIFLKITKYLVYLMKYQIVLKLECMVYHIILDYKSLPHTQSFVFLYLIYFRCV